MTNDFLIYGATGFVGSVIARRAVARGLRPLLAARNPDRLALLASELSLEARAFSLDQTELLESSLQEVPFVMHCAGPYIHTYHPMVNACLHTGTHYLDITGEIPVYTALARLDGVAQERLVMLLPGIGFDVLATDCLALHLKQRLPTATRLRLAFFSQGPARLPPGTANTLVEMIPYGFVVRREGKLVPAPRGGKSRDIDFGQGPLRATLLSWGDVFTAFYSTGIPDIEDYAVLPEAFVRMLRLLNRLQPLFRLAFMRSFIRRLIPAGSTPAERARSSTHVWGEVEDDQGRRAVSRLHGPEAGVEWTVEAALNAVHKVQAGVVTPGFQTPARVLGADIVLRCAGVSREDLPLEESSPGGEGSDTSTHPHG